MCPGVLNGSFQVTSISLLINAHTYSQYTQCTVILTTSNTLNNKKTNKTYEKLLSFLGARNTSATLGAILNHETDSNRIVTETEYMLI